MQTIHPNKKRTGIIAVLACLLLGAGALYAAEGSGSGVGTEVSYGNMQPPGNYYLIYLNHYAAGSAKGVNGRSNPAFRIFRTELKGTALRAQHVWKAKFLGAGMESIIAAQYAFSEIERRTVTGSNTGGKNSGLGDTLLIPVRLAWKGKTVSQAFALEFTAPTGPYDKTRYVNTGKNYWTVTPSYGFSVRPSPSLDANIKFRYCLNGANPDTHYKSGDEFITEFSAGYKLAKPTTIGFHGYKYIQVTNDELRGRATRPISVTLGGKPNTGTGNRGRVTATGPFIRHSFSKSFTAIIKYQHEFKAQNRSQGDRTWLQMLFTF